MMHLFRIRTIKAIIKLCNCWKSVLVIRDWVFDVNEL